MKRYRYSYAGGLFKAAPLVLLLAVLVAIAKGC